MSPRDKRPKRPGFRKRSVRQSVRDEFAFHLAMTVAELVDQGMAPAAAEREARRRFGRLEEYRRDCQQISRRDRRARRWRESMRGFGMDLRFAARRLARSPLFATVALLTLALGIGANTAVFTLVKGVVLQPLPYRAPDELVSVAMHRTDGSESDALSYPDYLDLRTQSETLAEIGFWTWWTMDITDADEPTSVQSVRVSPDMLSVIGAEPAEGRLFGPEEGEEGNDNVAILSHALWQDHYGGEPLVGTDIEIDGEPHTVVGIMPRGFRFPYVQDYGAGFWVPLPMSAEEESRSSRWLNAVARLAPNATPEQARIEIETIAARLAAEYPASNNGWTMRATPMHESVVGGGTRAALWTLYGVVAFVLLIACANLANLLLARMESRQHEIAVRAALGAGRGRLLRELLAETTLIGATGGLLGILLARQGMQIFISWVPEGVPRLDEIGFDGTVLGFAVAATAATCMLFGLLPAWHASRADLQSPIKVSSTYGAAGRQRLRSALVVVEIAVALVLLTGAGLLLRSFGNLLNEDIGFDPSRIVTFQLSPSNRDPAQRIAFFQQVVERLQDMPGVESVGANTAPPLSGVEWSMAYTIDGEPLPALGEEPSAEFNVVSPDYFRTLSIDLRAGRFSTEQDDPDRGRVVLVNETFARRHWPQGDAVGRSISIGDRAGDDAGEASTRPSFEIIGVVADTRKLGIDREPPAEMYLPYTLSAQYFMNFVVRTAGDPAALIDTIRSRVWEIDDDVVIEDVATMSSRYRQSVAEPRFNATLVGGFAALAMVLATLGIYGVVAYSASSRNREIGVRVALGAGKSDVFRLLLGQGLILTAAGIGVGLLVALGASRLLSSMVYGVTTTDPLTFAAVALLLAGVALSAAYVPARRAACVDPLVALRDDR
jgi:putative ABC transport system permease protein